MKLIKCPTVLTDISPQPDLDLSRFVFLGGGITGCPDWQAHLTKKLENQRALTLFNPRRDDFDASDPTMSEKQIEWEFYHLHNSDAIVFWFPAETLCPITLYELGFWAGNGFERQRHNRKTLFVGCHPKYKRRFDVIKQLSLVRPEIMVKSSLEAIAEDVSKFAEIFAKVYNLE